MEWEMVCRVCLQNGDMVSLFDCDENNELLRDKYLACCSIDVSENDRLPSNICLTCVDRLLSAYQFKQQCRSSYDTLKECLSELCQAEVDMQTIDRKPGSEVITIKQENGIYLQYEIPVDDDLATQWPLSKRMDSPRVKRKRGRPRKYPDEQGYISPSPYNKKEPQQLLKPKVEPAEGNQEHEADHARGDSIADEGELADFTSDPDYNPEEGKEGESDGGLMELTINPKDGTLMRVLNKSAIKISKKKGRPKRSMEFEVKQEGEEEEDVLLKETLMANSAPIREHDLQPRQRKHAPKKKYYYDKVHTCDQCGSSFRSNASLQAHIRRHLGIKPFVCNICGYACVLNMELRRHMMRHTGQKPYKCRICERYFGDFGSRQKHERLHLGERPYQCSLCGKSFTYSYVLSNHMLTHTGEKKYACTPCNKRFTKAHHLKYHNKVHHKEIYQQQQLLQQAKKIQHINISDLTSVCTEQLLGLSQGHIMGQTIQVQSHIDPTKVINMEGQELIMAEGQEEEEHMQQEEEYEEAEEYSQEDQVEMVEQETDEKGNIVHTLVSYDEDVGVEEEDDEEGTGGLVEDSNEEEILMH